MKQASWIWKKACVGEDTYIAFYDTIHGSSADIKISCDGSYALYVNEKLQHIGQYSDYPFYKVYDEFSLSGLTEGENSIKIVVWHPGRGTLNYYQSTPGLIYEITANGNIISYSSTDTMCAEEDGFVQGNAKNITWQLGFTHKFDMARNKNHTEPAELISKTMDLVKRPIKMLELSPTCHAAEIDKEKHIYDLGRETVGVLHLKAGVEKGKILRVAYSEHLVDGDMPFPKEKDFAEHDFYVEFLGSGEMCEVILPFRMLAGRYLKCICEGKFDVEFLGIQEVYYPVIENPFACDNKNRKHIYEIAKRTLHLCMHHHYDDCPWREQGYYSLDGALEMMYGYYAFQGFEYQRAALVLMAAGIRDDGMFPMCAPSSVDMVIPSFSLFYTIAVADYYRYSNDITLLVEVFDKIKKNLGVHIKNSEEGLTQCLYHENNIYWNFYEWTDGLSGGGAAQYKTDAALNTLFSLALLSAFQIAEALGETAQAEYYAQLHKSWNQRIHEKFYDEIQGAYVTFEKLGQTHKLVNAWAILAGIAPEQQAKTICEKLISDTSMVDTCLSTTAFVYDALMKVDKEKYREYILLDIDKKYGKMLEQGATSFWETMDGPKAFEGAGSLCHGWSAMPVKYYRELLL